MAVKALYGAVALKRSYCKACSAWSFVLDGMLQCCDEPADGHVNSVQRMSISVRRRLPKGQADKIVQEQKGLCFYCDNAFGSTVVRLGYVRPFKGEPCQRRLVLKPEIDHIYPFLLGGSMNLDNLVASCRVCNRIKRCRSKLSLRGLRALIRRKWDELGYHILSEENPQKSLTDASPRCYKGNMEPTMDSKELGRLLKLAGISQTELARRVGVVPQAVNQWLSGRRKMHPVFAKVVRDVLKKGSA